MRSTGVAPSERSITAAFVACTMSKAILLVVHLLRAGDAEADTDWLVSLPLQHFDEALHA